MRIFKICTLQPNIKGAIKARSKSQVGDVAYMGGKRKAYMVFMGKPEGKRSLGRCGHKQVNNIKPILTRQAMYV